MQRVSGQSFPGSGERRDVGTPLSKDFLTDIEGWFQNLWHLLTLHISFHRKIIMIGNIY